MGLMGFAFNLLRLASALKLRFFLDCLSLIVLKDTFVRFMGALKYRPAVVCRARVGLGFSCSVVGYAWFPHFSYLSSLAPSSSSCLSSDPPKMSSSFSFGSFGRNYIIASQLSSVCHVCGVLSIPCLLLDSLRFHQFQVFLFLASGKMPWLT